MDGDAVREFALSLPDATEAPHFHFTSFRIGGRIFATMPPGNELLHVFCPEPDREAAVAAHPEFCAVLHWGKRVVGVRIELGKADGAFVRDLIQAAYDEKSGSPGRRG